MANATDADLNFYKKQNLSQVAIQGVLENNIYEGEFVFEGLSFKANIPDFAVGLEITSNAIKRDFDFSSLGGMWPGEAQRNGFYLLRVNMTFRKCVQGEIFDEDKQFCFKCSFGRYSFDPSKKKCDECPGNVLCKGGNSFILNQGFWRSSDLSLEIHECAPFKQSCLYPLFSF